MMMMMMTCKK